MNNPLVQPDPGLYIWTIATFLILLWLLAKFAWRPLLAALEQRQETIRKSLDDAQQAKQDLERLNAESRKILAEARVQAEHILSQTRTDASRLRDELKQKAQSEAAGVIKNAERQIEMETRARVAADPQRSRGHLGRDRFEGARTQRHQGRQRAPHRGNLQADRSPSAKLTAAFMP